MSLFITGDCHGDFSRFNKFRKDKYSKDKDYVIILGDFGGIWHSSTTMEDILDVHQIEKLEKCNVTFIIIPGNHENYDAVESLYPTSVFNGAAARYIRPNIVWIERGEIFTLFDRTFWCFGGAFSLDKVYREPNKSWWYREEADENEKENGIMKLKQKPDFILTHDCPSSICHRIYPYFTQETDTSTYLERCRWILQNLEYDVDWYFGHHHMDWQWSDSIGATYHCLYGRIETLIK